MVCHVQFRLPAASVGEEEGKKKGTANSGREEVSASEAASHPAQLRLNGMQFRAERWNCPSNALRKTKGKVQVAGGNRSVHASGWKTL